jgi:hypothetical protein
VLTKEKKNKNLVRIWPDAERRKEEKFNKIKKMKNEN